MRARAPALAVVGLLACGGPRADATSSFGVGSGPAGESDSGGPSPASTSSRSTGTSEHIPEDSTSTTAGTSTTTGLLHDVGGPDFGDPKPAGCKGKIDFLFVITYVSPTGETLERLVSAIPTFLDIIGSKFPGFDIHIMVVDGDASWGVPVCTSDCPVLDCKVGDPCCPTKPGCHNDLCIKVGDPCCTFEDYPCELVDQLSACDETMGAGVVMPVGWQASNKQCGVAGGKRYLTGEQPDLAETFACIARVGAGGIKPGEAVTAAVSRELNDPGGCNEGFLRDDALLMVTFLHGYGDTESAGKPKLWAEAVVEAKNGDANAVTMLSISPPGCPPEDRICDLVMHYFPHWHIASSEDEDYGPAFDIATDKALEACSGIPK